MCWGLILLAGAPLIGQAVGVVAQIIFHMIFRRKPIVLSYAVGFLCGALGSLVTLYASAMSAGLPDVVVCLMTFGGLNYCYANFVNLNFTSLRIRLLKELLDSGGAEAAAEILRKYGSRAILRRRIERLLDWGQLERVNDRYLAKEGSFLRLALFFTFLKKLMLGRGFRYETRLTDSLRPPQG
jgi:hypothetical protein